MLNGGDHHHLTLGLFGTPGFTGIGAERAAELVERPKTLALLTYLALVRPRGLRRRDELFALFWPDSDPAHARNSLRQSLHSIRTALPPGSIASRGNHEIGVVHGGLQLDVWMYEQQLDHGQETSALALYVGDLLNNFVFAENPEFDMWLQAERARLRQRAAHGAMALARMRELDGDGSASAEWARYAHVRAPYDEALLREAMGLLHRQGDKSGAAHLYRGASARMEGELGVSLSDETQRLARTLLENEFVHSVHSSSTIGRQPNGGSPPLARSLTVSSPFVTPRAVTPEARRLYLKARQFATQRAPHTIMSAIDAYERAIRLSPDYAEAHVGLASAFCQAPVYSPMLGTDAWPRVREHASRALRLDPRIGEAHTLLAHATLCSEYDWTAAEQGYRKALELEPATYISRQLYALYFLTAAGRADEALEILDRARDEIPDVPGISAFYAMSCVFSRRYERALPEVHSLLEAHPDFVQVHWVHGMALEGSGDFDGAVRAFALGASMTGDSDLFISQLARACVGAGDVPRARRLLAQLDDRGHEGGPGAYYCVEVLAALGETELALDRLHAAYRQRNPFMVFANVLYGLDPLRGEKRFRDLLVRMGMPGSGRTLRS